MPINSVNADREAPRVGLKEADAILMTLGDCKKKTHRKAAQTSIWVQWI